MGYSNIQFDKDSLFLVTGGAGFIGSNLCEAILKLGYKVRCLDDLSTGKQENVDLFIDNPNYEFIKGDIKDFDTCMKACKDVTYVLNEAAWGSVPRSIEMPLFYCANNIQGTVNMMEAARQNGVKTFVYASSSSVYGDEPNLPKTEGREGNLLSPYALTKCADEEWAKQYSRHYGLKTIGLRYFNVYGPRESHKGSMASVAFQYSCTQYNIPAFPFPHLHRKWYRALDRQHFLARDNEGSQLEPTYVQSHDKCCSRFDAASSLLRTMP